MPVVFGQHVVVVGMPPKCVICWSDRVRGDPCNYLYRMTENDPGLPFTTDAANALRIAKPSLL